METFAWFYSFLTQFNHIYDFIPRSTVFFNSIFKYGKVCMVLLSSHKIPNTLMTSSSDSKYFFKSIVKYGKVYMASFPSQNSTVFMTPSSDLFYLIT